MSDMTGDRAEAASATSLDDPENRVLAELWSQTPFAADALNRARLPGGRSAPSSFKVAELAQATIAGAALAAAEFRTLRGGRPQSIAVEREHALVEFRSESYLRVNGVPSGEIRDPLSRLFRTS